MNELKTSLEKLVDRAKTDRLPAANPAVPIPVSVGVGVPAPGSSASGTGSGIASPLTETAYSARTFHPNVTLTSSDGIFMMVIKPVKQIKMRDAAGREIEFVYAKPT